MKYQGWDISLNHGAIVQLVDGDLDWFTYWTDKSGSAKKHRGAVHLNVVKLKKVAGDRHSFEHARLAFVRDLLFRVVTRSRPDFVAIEDYAMARAQGAHQIGEGGGAARLALWDHGIRYRTVDPYSVKMFATYDGTADKILVEEVVRDRWGADFGKYNVEPPKNKAKKANRQTSEDLCDAFTLAKLVYTEAMLRSGELSLAELEHNKERQVFMRVTKAFPVNILGREWIYNERWKKTLIKKLRGSMAYIREAA